MKFAAPAFSLLALSLLLAPFAAAQAATSPTPAATAPTVAKSNLITMPGYSLTAAGGWIMLKNTYQGDASLAGVALAGPAVKGRLNPSFIVTVTNVANVPKANRTLGVARDVRAEELPTVVQDFKWLGERSVKVGGGNTLGVLWSYSGKEQGVAHRWSQLMTLRGDRLYTVTLALPEGTRPDVAAAGREMLDSFKLR